MFFSTDSFHDAHVFSLNVKNKFNPNEDEDEKDPTLIEAHLLHSSGEEYLVKWVGVRKFLMDYDIQRNTYADSNEIAFDGERGLDDWIVDEITSYDSEYLCHEIILASDTSILIRCKNIEMEKL
ncbi:hypothetical protein [Gottfriedia solisilvae]|uniref:Uncharacterized protein n=1 Tax=Gottfriedia solisilvae TaxID=1516104 RepID=A0A8J3ACV5_9BACI|nr:hypothetical protein [Gottfriedia solisilvae]GGI11582.1 hypothetical protein GCM10007380_08560 [Gottfriedia solisilvae]